MRFFCITEKYRHFRGYVFMNNQPTDVKDRASIEALEKHPEFRKVEEHQDEKAVEAPTEKVLTPEKPQIPDVCPKCGRTVKRGKVMHAKYCKGPK